MNQKILIYYANKYSFVNDKTNQLLEGLTINYLTNTELKEVNVSAETRGTRHAKATLPASYIEKLDVVPGLYDAIFEIAADASGAMIAKVQDIAFSSAVKAEPMKK